MLGLRSSPTKPASSSPQNTSPRCVYSMLRGGSPRSGKCRTKLGRDPDSILKTVTTIDLTESTDNDHGSLSLLHLQRSKSYETDDAPATMASTQPASSADENDHHLQLHQVDYIPSQSPPPESVSLLKSGSICSELSDDDRSVVEEKLKQQASVIPEANEDDETSRVNFQIPPATHFVPPEYVYLTPDNCWPLEL